jgi:ABC-type sugar transport system substrate-binding protein
MVATATEVARRDGFTLQAFVPVMPTVTEQARLLGVALAARVRAIVIDPTNYAALLPYLRAAHDAEVPVVVLQTPRDHANPAFVASFIQPEQSSLDRHAAAALARIPHQDGAEVAVVTATPAPRTSGASLAGLERALGRARPSFRVFTATVDTAHPNTAQDQLRRLFAAHPTLTALVVGDRVVTASLRQPLLGATNRPAVVVTAVDAAALDLLSRSLVTSVVGADPCALTRAAMSNAVAAARNRVGAINASATVGVVTVSATNRQRLEAGCH